MSTTASRWGSFMVQRLNLNVEIPDAIMEQRVTVSTCQSITQDAPPITTEHALIPRHLLVLTPTGALGRSPDTEVFPRARKQIFHGCSW